LKLLHLSFLSLEEIFFLKKLLEIVFHFEVKNDFFNKIDFLNIKNQHYKNKKMIFLNKKKISLKKIQNRRAVVASTNQSLSYITSTHITPSQKKIGFEPYIS